jgi:hypothetical protein
MQLQEFVGLPPDRGVPRYSVATKALTSVSPEPKSNGGNSYIVAFGPGTCSPLKVFTPSQVIIGSGTAYFINLDNSPMDEKVWLAA